MGRSWVKKSWKENKGRNIHWRRVSQRKRAMIHRERYRIFIYIYYLWHKSVHTSTYLTEQASQFIWYNGLFLKRILYCLFLICIYLFIYFYKWKYVPWGTLVIFSIHPTCIISKTVLCHTIFFFFFSEKFHNIMLIVYHEEIKKRE